MKKREKYISKDCKYSFLYARNILKNPFIIGEEVISKDATYSYYYTIYVLNKSFPLGEEAISKDGFWSSCYARKILKSPFPKGEEAISKISYDNCMDYMIYCLSKNEKIEFEKKYDLKTRYNY